MLAEGTLNLTRVVVAVAVDVVSIDTKRWIGMRYSGDDEDNHTTNVEEDTED